MIADLNMLMATVVPAAVKRQTALDRVRASWTARSRPRVVSDPHGTAACRGPCRKILTQDTLNQSSSPTQLAVGWFQFLRSVRSGRVIGATYGAGSPTSSVTIEISTAGTGGE
jgi:hypothetical protein